MEFNQTERGGGGGGGGGGRERKKIRSKTLMRLFILAKQVRAEGMFSFGITISDHTHATMQTASKNEP